MGSGDLLIGKKEYFGQFHYIISKKLSSYLQFAKEKVTVLLEWLIVLLHYSLKESATDPSPSLSPVSMLCSCTIIEI